MKHKCSVVIAAVVLGLTITLLAAQKQPAPTSSPKLIRLKSNGDTIAELRIPKGTILSISGKQTGYDTRTERQVAKGNVTIEIRRAGRSAVVVKTDEMEMVPE